MSYCQTVCMATGVENHTAPDVSTVVFLHVSIQYLRSSQEHTVRSNSLYQGPEDMHTF